MGIDPHSAATYLWHICNQKKPLWQINKFPRFCCSRGENCFQHCMRLPWASWLCSPHPQHLPLNKIMKTCSLTTVPTIFFHVWKIQTRVSRGPLALLLYCLHVKAVEGRGVSIKRGSTVLKNKTIILNKISTALLNKENRKKKNIL